MSSIIKFSEPSGRKPFSGEGFIIGVRPSPQIPAFTIARAVFPGKGVGPEIRPSPFVRLWFPRGSSEARRAEAPKWKEAEGFAQSLRSFAPPWASANKASQGETTSLFAWPHICLKASFQQLRVHAKAPHDVRRS